MSCNLGCSKDILWVLGRFIEVGSSINWVKILSGVGSSLRSALVGCTEASKLASSGYIRSR